MDPGRKAAGYLQGLRPAGQTGLRVEVVLSIPTAPLRRDRGKSPRKPMFSELRTPRKLCWRHNFRPPARSRRKARTTNNPAEVCPGPQPLEVSHSFSGCSRRYRGARQRWNPRWSQAVDFGIKQRDTGANRLRPASDYCLQPSG